MPLMSHQQINTPSQGASWEQDTSGSQIQFCKRKILLHPQLMPHPQTGAPPTSRCPAHKLLLHPQTPAPKPNYCSTLKLLLQTISSTTTCWLTYKLLAHLQTIAPTGDLAPNYWRSCKLLLHINLLLRITAASLSGSCQCGAKSRVWIY